MKHPKTLPCAALAAIFAAQTAALGSVNDYAYCAEITVAGAAEGVSLANFPALVRVSAARIDGFAYSQLSSPTDGADLRFTDSEGHFLPHDIDTWNPDGESLVWVSVPTLANGEKITMRWGNASPVETNDPATVWSAAGYVQVWHFSTGVTTDATGRGLSLTLGGSGIQASSDALLGGCYTNSATTADTDTTYINFPSHEKLLDNITNRTVSGWFRANENLQTGGSVRTVFFASQPDYTQKGFRLSYLNGGYYISCDGNSGGTSEMGNWYAYYNTYYTWTMFGMRLTESDGDLTGSIFRQGERIKGPTAIPGGISATTTPVSMGNFGNGAPNKNAPFYGDMDEFRVNKTALSDEWMKEEYATVAADGYLTYGAAALRPYVAFLRADETDTLPAAYGVPEATFSDVEAAVAATVAAKNDGHPSATLYIAPGTYRAQSDALRATNGVSIVGIGARDETILTGPEGSDSTAWNHRVLLLSDGGFLANVTILGTKRDNWDSGDSTTDNWCRYGAAVLLEGAETTASNIVVRGSTASRVWTGNEFYGSIHLSNTSRLEDSLVTGNVGGFWGAGVSANGYAVASRCVITNNETVVLRYNSGGNSQAWGGGVYLNGRGTIVDCLVAGNRAGTAGGGVYHRYGQNNNGIFHCTIAGNSAPIAAAIYANQYADIANSIIWGNASDDESASVVNTDSSRHSLYRIKNCCLDTELLDTFTESGGNIVANPRFANAEGGDYTLRPNSPCIDAGAPSVSSSNVPNLGTTPSTWLALNYVPHCHNDETDTWDGAPDIGCYESTNVRQDAMVVVFR